jgi:drug/metabolite transporter (DMT)-like permease
VVGLGGQFLITRAYQIGEASALAPLDFVRLLLATLSGFLIFAEVPSLVTIVGAALVVGGTIYTMRRNAIPKPLPDVERH